MIDWNNDGRIDPAEVVLTDIILSEEPDCDAESGFLYENESPDKPEPWLTKLFRRRRQLEK